jgi:hypothetical protein
MIYEAVAQLFVNTAGGQRKIYTDVVCVPLPHRKS